MSLCALCKRIKEIRVKQGKPYLDDLCWECKKKVLNEYRADRKKLANLKVTMNL